MALSGPLPELYHLFANLYFVAVLAIGMALFRELDPGWRPGYTRVLYDLVLMGVTVLFALGVVYYLGTIKAV